MSVVGYQDFWVVGARCLFKRDDIDDVPQPLINLGLIRSVSPSISPTEIKLFDPAGGVLNLVDQAVTQQEEGYDLTCANFNGDNLALLFLSEPPVEFTQAAAGHTVSHVGHGTALLNIEDSNGVHVFSLEKIIGVYSGEATGATVLTTMTSVTPSTRTFSFTASTGLSVNDKFILRTDGSVSVDNAGTYTVQSLSGSGPWLVVSVETPGGSTQTGLTGTAVVKAGIYPIGVLDDHYEIVSLPRGEIRLTGSDFYWDGVTGDDPGYGDVVVVYATNAISGKRLITPQSIKGSIKGTMWLYLGRENDTRQSVRECRVSMLPSGQSLKADDFSDFTLKVSVLSNITDDNAGRLIQITGDLPDPS